MILKIFIFWRLGLFLVTYIGSLFLPKVANFGLGAVGPNKDFNYWASWAQWDGGYYLAIAQNGYWKAENSAFFPFYPILIKIVAYFFGENYLFAGLFVSNIALLLFLLTLTQVISKNYSKKIAYSVVFTFLLFPTTFFSVAVYSEGLFLLFVILTLNYLKKKKYLIAALLVSIASLTRIIGSALIISVFYKYFNDINSNIKKINIKVISISISFLGILIYIIYLLGKFGNPFIFLNVQSLWMRFPMDPISTIFSYFWGFLTGQKRPINDYFDFGITLLFLIILILGRKKIPSSWWIFSMLVILIPASTGTLTSMPRYVLSAIGTFVILGQFLEDKVKLRTVLWAVMLFVQVILASLFITGHWIA